MNSFIPILTKFRPDDGELSIETVILDLKEIMDRFLASFLQDKEVDKEVAITLHDIDLYENE